MKLKLNYNNKEYEITIDDEDYNKIKDLNLNILTERSYKKRIIDSKSKTSLYRFIMDTKPNQICLHKNNDRFDFRKENLFITTSKELKDMVRTGQIQQRFDERDRLYYVF